MYGKLHLRNRLPYVYAPVQMCPAGPMNQSAPRLHKSGMAT